MSSESSAHTRITLADIAASLNQPALSIAQGQTVIAGIAALSDAGPADVTMITSDAYLKQFARTQAAVVVAQRKVRLPSTGKIVFIVDDVEKAVAEILTLFAPPVQRPRPGIDPAARISESATLGRDCAVGPNVVIGARAAVGAASFARRRGHRR